jgi:hypothetical protein
MNPFARILLVVATASTMFVALAESKAKKVPVKEAPADVQKKKLDKLPDCPAGCTPGRKSGLKEHLFSDCPEGCRPASAS